MASATTEFHAILSCAFMPLSELSYSFWSDVPSLNALLEVSTNLPSSDCWPFADLVASTSLSRTSVPRAPPMPRSLRSAATWNLSIPFMPSVNFMIAPSASFSIRRLKSAVDIPATFAYSSVRFIISMNMSDMAVPPTSAEIPMSVSAAPMAEICGIVSPSVEPAPAMRLVRSAIVGAVAVDTFDSSFRTDPMFFACLIGILNWFAILASAAPPSSAENSDTDASFATVSVNDDRFSTPLMPSCPPISPMLASSFALFGIFEDISTKRSPSFLISASVMPDVF